MDLPHDDKLEKTLVSTLLAHPETISKVCSFLPPEGIYNARIKAVYTGIYTLYHRHQPISPATVSESLLELDLYKQSGGLEFIQDMPHNGVEPAHAAPRLAEVVHDHWLRRQQIEIADKLKEQALNRKNTLQDRLSLARQQLTGLQQKALNDGTVIDGKTGLDMYLDLLGDRSQKTNKIRPTLPWQGFKKWPSPPPGTLIGILGNPGGGKTVLMECISEKWWQQGFKGVYFHLEDPLQVKLDRRMARWTGISFKILQDPYRVNTDYLSHPQWSSIIKATTTMSEWPGDLTLVHCPGWTMGQIVAKLEQIYEITPLDYVIVDYLNKVKPDDRGKQGLNYTQGRGQDIEDFKSTLERLEIIGLMGGQFDKKSKSSDWRTLADLRDSGELDDKVQMGLIINRQMDNDNRMSEMCEVVVSKCNFGETGPVTMRMVGPRFLFTDNLSYREEVNADL